jgi:uncharacterized protein (DUF58 family)
MGITVGSAPIVFIGGAILLVRIVAQKWPKRVLDALVYERTIHPVKTVVGDEVEIRLSIWNRSRLPIAYASADETISPQLRVTSRGGEVAIAGPMRPFEKVTRKLRVQPLARGVHEVGPVRVGVGEHFGTQHPYIDIPSLPATITARPLMVPVVGRTQHASSLAQLRARRSLYTDPTLFAGVRPFQTGDPVRSIHWRASARIGSTQSKRFEPALSRQQVLVLDVQTVEGPYWMLGSDEQLFEELCVAALSLARTLITDDAACGFAAAGFSHTTQRFAYLPPRADRAQIERIGDVLARLTPESSAPLASLLGWLPTRVAKGTTIAILSGRSPRSTAAVVKRLQSSGFPCQFLLFGSGKEAESLTEARRLGIPAWSSHISSERGQPKSMLIDA